jgi:hypothetical protein
MLVQDNVNAHGWFDQSSNIQFALNWCHTNTLGKTELFLPPGIYRIATNKITCPPAVNITGVGFLHYGIQDIPDLSTTNYSMLWFDNTNATGLWFANMQVDINNLSYVQIEGFTNPVATSAAINAAPFNQLGISGLVCCDTNYGWCGGFTAEHVAVAGFRIGVATSVGQSEFRHCNWIDNGIGFAATAPGNGYMMYATNPAVMPSTAYYWSNCLSYWPSPGNAFADQVKIFDCGGGWRSDGLVYWIDSARAVDIDHDSSFAFHGLGVFGCSQAVNFHDTYVESYENNYTATNPIVLLGGDLSLKNFNMVYGYGPSNANGDPFTNIALVDCTVPVGAWNCQFDTVIFSGSSIFGLSVLFQSGDNSYGKVDVKGDARGLYRYKSVSGLLDHYDLLIGGSTYYGNYFQMNNEWNQYGTFVTTNLSTASLGGINYGVPILQRGVPDYLSIIVRSNSIGQGIVGAPSYETTVSVTNNNYYFARLLQSDYPGTVTYNSNTKSFDIEQNYTVDQITVRSNLIGNGSGLTNAAGNPFLDKTATNSVCQTNDSRAVTMTNANNVFAGTFNSVTNTIVLGYGRINGTFGSLPSPYNNMQGYAFPTNSTGIYGVHYILPDELQGRTNIQIICTYVATNSGTGFIPYFHFYGTGPTSATAFTDTSYNPNLSYVNGFNYFTNTYHISPSYTNMYFVNQIGDNTAPTNGIWLINVKEILW